MKVDEIQHDRFDFEHYKGCQACYEARLDFEQEQAIDAQLDLMSETQ